MWYCSFPLLHLSSVFSESPSEKTDGLTGKMQQPRLNFHAILLPTNIRGKKKQGERKREREVQELNSSPDTEALAITSG